MSSHLEAYKNQLLAHMEETRRRHELKVEAEAKAKLAASIAQVKRTKPLTDQINELMATIPHALRNRPWTMAELVTRLSGRYNDRPHAQHVGEALRKLGWRRERRWSDGFDGQRVWVPSG